MPDRPFFRMGHVERLKVAQMWEGMRVKVSVDDALGDLTLIGTVVVAARTVGIRYPRGVLVLSRPGEQPLAISLAQVRRIEHADQ